MGYMRSREVITWAASKYSKDATDQKYEMFLPTPTVYGSENYSHSHFLYRQNFLEKIKNSQTFKHVIPQKLFEKNLNNNSFITNAMAFKPEESPEYQIDGVETKPFEKDLLPEF
jgi:hypothetical protein